MPARIDLSQRRLTPEQWQLVADHRGLAVYMTHRATGKNSDDVRNDAILEAAENGLIIAAEKWHAGMGCPFGTYAGGVIWRSTQRMKNIIKKRSMYDVIYEDESIDPRNDFDRMELVDLVKHLMDRLSERERRLMQLKFFEGKMNKEIASVYGVSIETVKVRIKRCLDKCRLIADQRAFV